MANNDATEPSTPFTELLDALAIETEHRDITRIEAFRELSQNSSTMMAASSPGQATRSTVALCAKRSRPSTAEGEPSLREAESGAAAPSLRSSRGSPARPKPSARDPAAIAICSRTPPRRVGSASRGSRSLRDTAPAARFELPTAGQGQGRKYPYVQGGTMRKPVAAALAVAAFAASAVPAFANPSPPTNGGNGAGKSGQCTDRS